MRVTKIVREYIEQQVRAKVSEKYEEQRLMEKNIRDIKMDIVARANEAARNAAIEIYREAYEHENILEFSETEFEKHACLSLGWNTLSIKDNPCLNWQRKRDDEAERIVKEIVVTLELGGNKADLDRMLSEI